MSHGDFPRSRLGEKQRGKVLASWVTRKLRTIAQFSIRDVESPENLFAEAPQPRASKSSKPASLMGNSMRRSNMVPENDVPRSPAPVPEETHEMQHDPHYEEQEPNEHTAVHGSATTHDTAAPIPQIAEPTHAAAPDNANPSDMTGGPSALDQLDFGSDFAEFANRASSVQPAELSAPGGPAQPPPLQLPQGRDLLPSQKRLSGVPAGAPVTEHGSSQYMPSQPGTHEENLEDWPQEALMYQSAWDADGAYDEGVHRAPTNASGVRQRYDGSAYGY